MLFAAVEAPPVCTFQPRSLQQLALRRFVQCTDWYDVIAMYLDHEFSDRLYEAMCCERKYLHNAHEYHDWSVANSVPIEAYLSIMNYNLKDGTPPFAFPRNLVSRCFVRVHFKSVGVLNVPAYSNLCIPCYNTYARFNSSAFHRFEKFVLIRDQQLIEDDELIDYMQHTSNWCSRCNSTSLFSIRDGTNLGPQWFDNIYLMCNEIPLSPVTDDN